MLEPVFRVIAARLIVAVPPLAPFVAAMTFWPGAVVPTAVKVVEVKDCELTPEALPFTNSEPPDKLSAAFGTMLAVGVLPARLKFNNRLPPVMVVGPKVLAPAELPVRVNRPPPPLVRVALDPEITLLTVSEPPLITLIECDVLPNDIGKLMVSKLVALSVSPAIVVSELPPKV